jgi:cobalt-zinc-cadmium efflux system protein
LTDAVHNLTDVFALALSGFALRVAERPAHSGKTFGYHRVGILAALINSTTLAVIALGVLYEAYRRFANPPEVMADTLTYVAGMAFCVNLGTAWLVGHGHQHDLNLHSAFLHLMGDVFSTLGAVAAGIAIQLTGLNWLDPLAGGLIGLLILYNAWRLVRETVDILLEATPSDIDMSGMVRDMMAIPGVRSVHDLHVWSLSRSLRMCTAHVAVENLSMIEGGKVLSAIQQELRTHYGIAHSTLQLESEICDPDRLYCDLNGEHPHSHSH